MIRNSGFFFRKFYNYCVLADASFTAVRSDAHFYSNVTGTHGLSITVSYPVGFFSFYKKKRLSYSVKTTCFVYIRVVYYLYYYFRILLIPRCFIMFIRTSSAVPSLSPESTKMIF